MKRTYREDVHSGLSTFGVKVGETDLMVSATKLLRDETEAAVRKYRHQLEGYIATHPSFEKTLSPCGVDSDGPEIVKAMAAAARAAGVGPMAAVAGAIAEFVGRDLLKCSEEIIVENGGDIFIRTTKMRRIAVLAGGSALSKRIALQISPQDTPLGICTSSGTVGPSISLGKADAATILSPSTSLADAVATAMGNLVKEEADIDRAVEFAKGIQGVKGALVIKGERMAIWGDLRLVKLK